MNFRRSVDHLFPRRESDPKLREYLDRLGSSGLLTLGAVEMAAALVQYFARADSQWLARSVAMLLVGAVTLAATRIRRRSRLLAWLSAVAAPSMLLLNGSADDYAMTAVMLVVITAVASVPFLPWQAFALGAAHELLHLATADRMHGDAHHVLLTLLALLVAGIAASNYAHRRSEFEAQQEAVRVAETLTGAQLRAQLAESAISIGKMAAALSHEINSPLGVLRSSVSTLCSMADRQIDPERMARARGELQRSIEESAARIEEVTTRLRRFVSLEDAEVKSADINELLTDVTLLHQAEIDKAGVRMEFDLERELQRLNCRPQLLTAAFSNLLTNAIQAVNGDGKIGITTRGRDGEVEVTIRDNGRGMSAAEAENAFDPSFKVAAGRVASGNWSLFNSRQIVYEHGGAIRMETVPGQGTAMYVTLPFA